MPCDLVCSSGGVSKHSIRKRPFSLGPVSRTCEIGFNFSDHVRWGVVS